MILFSSCREEKPAPEYHNRDSHNDITRDTRRDLSSDTVSPDTDNPDTSTPDTVTPDTVTPDTVTPDTDSPDTNEPDDIIEDSTPDLLDSHTPEDAPDTTEIPDQEEDTQSGPDAERPQGDNIFCNGGFERWTDDLPECWYGEESNIWSEDVIPYDNEAYEGQKSCQLVNEDDRHKRFTTQPITLPQGRYDCTYQVMGHGEIRNADYDGDYSSYTGYYTVNSDTWIEKYYDFSQPEGVEDVFELVFSVRNTHSDHILIDDVQCYRESETCDLVNCESWQECDRQTGECEPLDRFCDTDSDCREWRSCNSDHECILSPGRCESMEDCDPESENPLCDTSEHTCIPGDPCSDVECDEWMECDPNSSHCVLSEDRCRTTDDCLAGLPACDTENHICVSVDNPVNIFPNGGFESWNIYDIPYHGEHLIPDGWFGLVFGDGVDADDYDTEINPDYLVQYSDHTHGGDYALQIIQTDIADRFTSEGFDVPSGSFTCHYWVRGHGGVRHRSYSKAGLSPETPRLDLNSEEWVRVPFEIRSNAREFRLVFYVSYTESDLDHIQIDDVVCTQN